MQRYKNRNDIDYIKLYEFNEELKRQEYNNTFDVLEFFKNTWNTENQLEFYKAIETPGKIKNYKFNIDLKKAETFIDLDTLVSNDKIFFLKLAVKKKYFWQKIKIDLETANYAFALFYERAAEIKDKFTWIYNPPELGEQDHPMTAGSHHRREFAEHYGGYPEMIYMLLQNRIFKSKEEIYNSTTDEFLFWSEYVLRKRKIENIK